MQARKTFRRILTIALTLALAVSSALAAAATAYPFTTVTNDQVNMRRSADGHTHGAPLLSCKLALIAEQ